MARGGLSANVPKQTRQWCCLMPTFGRVVDPNALSAWSSLFISTCAAFFESIKPCEIVATAHCGEIH